ncbi:PREDICTED: zinc finger protein Xfin-like [Eufriesea mexicana]|uniref:zinc finger protein Xfin-like n=1 Tax=Eufriesea mexicana TaxID=516756 RepID=UPI00083C6317|nr:PREDICTED: zinc finger protein Xfin-like [Eufriesea mexicana]
MGHRRSNWFVKPSQYACPNPNCRSVFAWKRNLTSHLRYQCGQKPRFKCPYCDYVCKVKADIRKHIRIKHKNNDVYVIDIFESWQTKIESSDPFTKIKRFPCPNCTSAFGQKPSLTRHLRYECRQEPRFQCPYCHQRSKKTSDIYAHIRRKHANSKVFVIDIHGSIARNSNDSFKMDRF